MNVTQYAELRAKEDVANGEEIITAEMKRQTVIEYLSEAYGEQFTSIDEAILYDMNINWYGIEYKSLEEAMKDETVQADWGTTKEQIYYNFYYYEFSGEGKEMTEEEMIEAFYRDAIADKYITEFNKYTRNLSVYVEKDGVQELIKSTVNLGTRPTTLTYSIGENGTYEFVVKTKDGEEVAREIMQTNNIATPNPYVLTKEEAEGVWETDGNGKITKYTGQDTSVAIPAMIGTELITKIGYQAFYENSNITNVTMTNVLTVIGESSFSKCDSLKNISISNGVKYIERYAFFGCKNLTTIAIPDNVVALHSGAFDNCVNLSDVTLSQNLTTINNNTFYRCYSLKSIVIPNGVKTINQGAFWSCTGLTDITIPETVTSIEHHAFKNCKSLESITLPNSITALDIAFEESPNLININFAPGDNPIPDGQPWGAPNENLVVTKLTE